MENEERGMKVLRRTASMLFGIVLCISIQIVAVLMFLYALNEQTDLPAIGGIPETAVEYFFSSWILFVIGSIMVLFPILVILFVNIHCIRVFFSVTGTFLFASAMTCVFVSYLWPWMIKRGSELWQRIFADSVMAFKSFSVLCTVILILAGVLCWSVYACIRIVKGGSYEKNN